MHHVDVGHDTSLGCPRSGMAATGALHVGAAVVVPAAAVADPWLDAAGTCGGAAAAFGTVTAASSTTTEASTCPTTRPRTTNPCLVTAPAAAG
jgi:hypothetical protein